MILMAWKKQNKTNEPETETETDDLPSCGRSDHEQEERRQRGEKKRDDQIRDTADFSVI